MAKTSRGWKSKTVKYILRRKPSSRNRTEAHNYLAMRLKKMPRAAWDETK